MIFTGLTQFRQGGQNPFFRYSTSIRSNINGGLGYWAGYGAREYLLEPQNHDNPIELKK
jgi:hypothetical protein